MQHHGWESRFSHVSNWVVVHSSCYISALIFMFFKVQLAIKRCKCKAIQQKVPLGGVCISAVGQFDVVRLRYERRSRTVIRLSLCSTPCKEVFSVPIKVTAFAVAPA